MPSEAYDFDVAVAGAGPAGIAAAVEAARAGAKVALIERYGCVGGNLTSGYVGPLLGGVAAGTITDEISKRLGARPNACFDFEHAKFALTELLYENGVDVFLQTHTVSADCAADGTLRSVKCAGKSGISELSARIFVDATGDGDLAVAAGCEWEYGRDGDSLVQPVSIMYIIENIAPEQKLICCHEEHYTDLGNGTEYLDLCHRACESGELPPSVNIVRLYNTNIPGERMVNATQQNRVNPLKPAELFRAEYELRRQMEQINAFLIKNVPGFQNIRVKGSASTLGVRESRRIIGDYILTAEDIIAGRKFDDAVVHNANFCIDIHNPDGPGQAESKGCPVRAMNYDIPYRCLLPLGRKNLLTAGRCISGTHRACASYRVMRIAMAVGQAAGAAAALCVRNGCDTRGISAGSVREYLRSRGVQL